MNSLGRRVLSLLLCMCMVLSFVPTFAFAAETTSDTQATDEENSVVNDVTEETTEATEASEETIPAEPVKYTVAHYLWDWDANDYVLLETEEQTGVPGELTNAQEKAYEGCILEEDIAQAEILADGSTVVVVRYIKLLEEAAPYVGEGLYDTSVSDGYFTVISAETFELAPGAVEHEIVLNNAEGNDRKVAHVFEVDTKNEDLEVMPGYYGIDKLNPDDLAGDKAIWTDKQLSQTVKYYEDVLGYNVVGAMNTALAYDSNAPYGYMVWNGVVLGTPEIHKGAQTYLAIDWDGNVELRSMSTPLTGNEKTAIPANFGWLVKDGKLTSTSVERTSSDASRSMVGVKADGTLIFCLVDGRNGAVSSGLSNYEMGEMMLALGCVNAFNGDGGGSSTFISKRAGESVNTMRSVPSDGSERATINSVILVSTAGRTDIFNKALIETEYNYIAPGANMAIAVTGLDTKGYTMDVPADVTYRVAEEGMGTIANGVFTAGNTTGSATIEAVYNGEVVGTKVLNVVHPEFFGFDPNETVLPYGKTMDLEVLTKYGADDWFVCVEGAYTFSLSDDSAATLNGNQLIATADETKTGVVVTAIYTPDASKTGTLKVTYGKGSEILFNFEDGNVSNFMGIDEMMDWAAETNAPANITADGNFSENTDAQTFLATLENGGQVKNGEYSLGVTLDYTDATFASWAYNMFFYTGEQIVLRDVANGMNATTLGMWVYIPEGAAGLAMQIQGIKTPGDTTSGTGAHFMFTNASGAVKNLNSCTEADIPESRWVYATVDLTQFGDYFATYDPMATNSRSPSFIRYYVKPATAAKLTFYFDDFTLDYSSAVDDRVLPTISNITYSTQDTAIELGDGAEIAGNTVTFTANVADNLGLDNTTGKILVDGIALNTTVSGKVMTADAVVLGAGEHTVSFEIKDKLGNLARVTRTFTISGDAAFSLTGHNDSGELAEYGSVYYMDLMAADLDALQSATATLKLQSANTWEPAGIVAAPGFTYTYSVNQYSNELTITVTKESTATIGEGAPLVSIPVRMWTWNGSDHVTDTPIAPATQFATGYCPIINIDCEITYGKAEMTSGTSAFFGGSYFTATMMNDNVNPWHYHDAELTVLNQEATCTEAGYENRTYCETCQSVIDWGTKTEAAGHNYNIVNNNLVCDCGDTLSASGLVKVNGKVYCLIAGNLMSGWQGAGNDGSVTKWCYADPNTMEVCTGEFTVDGLTYTADEDGVLVSGVWVENFLGRRYSFGPKFYQKTWATIDGVQYYFGSNTYAYTGYHQIRDNENNKKTPYRWFLFGEDGALVDDMKDYYGFLDVDGVKYFLEGGIGNTYIGTTKIDDNGLASENGSYYYLDESGKVMTGKQWVGSYLQSFSKFPLPTGNYEFDENGKMLDGIVTKEDGTYYYEMGKPVDTGWLKVGEDYYVFTNGGKALTGRHWVGTYLTETSKNPYKTGNFIFAQDGKLVNGIAYVDGIGYYCVAGVGKEAGLVKVDGEYYYADVNGVLATGRIWVGTYPSNGLLAKGYYEFGADGKLLNGVVEKEDGTYFFENGRPVDTGWLKVGDDYYVFTDGGKALTGANWVGTYLTQTSRDPYRKGNFFFAADGKLAGGVVEMEDGYYYFEKGVAKEAGLICLDGTYYLAEAGGKLATGRVWVGTYASNGLLAKGYYEFGANGAMLQGVVEKEDGLYYYDLGNTRYLGLIERDGEYYYVNEGGKLEIGRVWIGTYPSNGLLNKGYYEFGADGAMLNGFETLSDGIYYYNKGVATYIGLKVIDGDLYYIEEGGKVMTGRVYVGTYASNGLLPRGTYTFAEDGKFVG